MTIPDDPISRWLIQVRDLVHNHYHRAYLWGTAIILYSVTFPSLKAFAICYLLTVIFGLLIEPCVNPYNTRYGTSLVQGDANRGNRVALTFDDGPAEDTAALLDVLAQERVPAAFFCIGQRVEQQNELVLRAMREGHLIGNHSQTHRSLLLSTPKQGWQELEQASDTIERLTGTRPTFFRPPYGFRSFWTGRQLRQQGLRQVLWSVNSMDAFGLTTEEIVEKVVKNVAPGGIVLLHDGPENRSNTVEAVSRLIPLLREQGYQFVRLDEL